MREATTTLAYEEDARRLRCTRHAGARGLGFECWSAVEGDTANKHVSVGSAEGPGGAGGPHAVRRICGVTGEDRLREGAYATPGASLPEEGGRGRILRGTA